jgi:hypothetical protein
MSDPKTAVQKFGLWLRPVSVVFTYCCAIVAVFGVVALCALLFQTGRWYFGVPVLMVGASVAIGTIYYLVDKHEHPHRYR